MVENLRSRFTFIALLLIGAVYCIFVHPKINEEPAFNLGLDLKGGTEMRFSFPDIADEPNPDARKEAIETVKTIFDSRLNATGLEEISVRVVGESMIEVAIPGISPSEAESYQAILTSQGKLQFLIRATSGQGFDPNELETALVAKVQELRDAGVEVTRDSTDVNATLADVEVPGARLKWYGIAETYEADFRDQNPGNPQVVASPEGPYFMLLREEGEVIGDQWVSSNPSGAWLESTRKDVDQKTGLPAVAFTVKRTSGYSAKFGRFTGGHEGQQMAIVLDGQVQSAPNIQSAISTNGIITLGTGAGPGDLQEEQHRLVAVLKGGSMDSKPVLESQSGVGPTLGKLAIDRGILAGLVALGLVLVFMVVYYLKAGVVACISLSFNMLLLMGTLAFLDATLTLPGIAGLVLTIGMAVDANILIFERIREEADKGKNLAQSVRNGFDRAFFTIVDANVTTFLTAFFLYRFGTPTIRGFAVTLMIGIATSMFSALYFSKSIFAWWVDRRPEKLPLKTLVKTPNFQFLKHRTKAAYASVAAIAIGLIVFFFAVDRDAKYGMDFIGGHVTQVHFASEVAEDELKQTLNDTFEEAVDVVRVTSGEGEQGSRYQLKVKLQVAESSDDADAAEASRENHRDKVLAALSKFDLMKEGVENLEISAGDDQNSTVRCTLNFLSDVDPREVERALGSLLGSAVQASPVQSGNDRSLLVSGVCGLALDEAGILARLERELKKVSDKAGNTAELSSPTPLNGYIGPRAGTELADAAIRAILFSLAGIILYIRIRFRQYRYGLAACLALIHDVAITLGLMGLIMFVVGPVLDLEINLAIIAAFLTIIGYSLNDTIVIFDRVRENLPRLEQPLSEVLDRSINQTLSRTILTTLTTFIVVLILFVFNFGQRNVLEGFAFSLLIGVLVGTYSTIFIASPAVLYLAQRIERKKAEARAAT